MTKNTCLPFFHKWSKWSLVVNGYVGKSQWRICERCGRVQHSGVPYAEGANASQINKAVEEKETDQ